MSDTPKAQTGTWILTAPDGRFWKAESPLKVASLELRERVPVEVGLQRILDALDDIEPAYDGQCTCWYEGCTCEYMSDDGMCNC